MIVDGRGRLTRLGWLRSQPFWRDVLILCCAGTPGRAARQASPPPDRAPGGQCRARRPGRRPAPARPRLRGPGGARTDAGGTLNGLLLGAGLVDELSVVLAPHLAGAGHLPVVHLVEGLTGAALPQLTLASVDRLPNSHLWLRYSVAAS